MLFQSGEGSLLAVAEEKRKPNRFLMDYFQVAFTASVSIPGCLGSTAVLCESSFFFCFFLLCSNVLLLPLLSSSSYLYPPLLFLPGSPHLNSLQLKKIKIERGNIDSLGEISLMKIVSNGFKKKYY